MAGRDVNDAGPEDTTASRISFFVLVPLLVVFVAVGLIQADRDAPAVDEAVDLTAGLVAVDHRDMRMNPEHGLLPHVGSALLPVLVADPLVPKTASYEDGDWFDYTDDLIRANAADGRLDDVVFWFRVMPLLVAAATGLMLHRFIAGVLGETAGLVAAGLWLTTPYVVGLAHLGTVDVWYTAALMAVALAASRAWRIPGTASTLVLGAAIGAAMLVRHQAAVLVVVGFVLILVRDRGSGRSLTQLVGVVLVPVALVWVAYRAVDTTPVQGEPRERFEQVISTAAAEGPIERLAVSAPLPVEWRAGVGYLVVTSEPRPAYLLGSAWEGGRPWYFLGSALVKVPLAATAMVVLGAIGWWRRRADARVVAIVVAVAFGAEAVFLHAQPLNLGLRLALPLLALAFVIAGGVTQVLRGRALVAVLAVLAVVQVGSFAWAHPHSLAWTPPPFGDGYRFVSDSSIDLAQATDAVRARHRHRPFVATSLMLPRGVRPVGGLPRIEDVEPAGLVGDVAVSANELTVLRRDELAWLRAYCPVDVIAHSVLVYRFEAPPDVSPGPTTPRPPCDGDVSTR